MSWKTIHSSWLCERHSFSVPQPQALRACVVAPPRLLTHAHTHRQTHAHNDAEIQMFSYMSWRERMFQDVVYLRSSSRSSVRARELRSSRLLREHERISNSILTRSIYATEPKVWWTCVHTYFFEPLLHNCLFVRLELLHVCHILVGDSEEV